MLSRFAIAFLPRSKCLLISWLQSPSAVIWESKKIKSVTVSTVSPSVCYEVTGPDAMIFIFWMFSFKSTFSLSSFIFIKRLFSSSSLSAIRVGSSAYLRLLIFLMAILIPACASSSTDFHQTSVINSENNHNFQLYSAPSERDPCAWTAFVSKEHCERMGSGHGKRKRKWDHQRPAQVMSYWFLQF